MKRTRSEDRGATLVEFALIAPLLFLLLFGVIEFGRVIATFTAVTTAAREGARYGTTVGDSDVNPGTPRYLDCAGIRNAARSKAVLVTLADSDIQITYDNGPGTAVDAGCQGGLPAPTPALVQSGDRITVTVRSQFQSPIPLISNFLGTLNIQSTQSRSTFRGVLGGP